MLHWPERILDYSKKEKKKKEKTPFSKVIFWHLIFSLHPPPPYLFGQGAYKKKTRVVHFSYFTALFISHILGPRGLWGRYRNPKSLNFQLPWHKQANQKKKNRWGTRGRQISVFIFCLSFASIFLNYYLGANILIKTILIWISYLYNVYMEAMIFKNIGQH